MNENLNLVEILKDCPKGTKLYSSVFGEVELDHIDIRANYPIVIRLKDLDVCECLTKEGTLFTEYDGECILFPSREERDWSKFKPIYEFKDGDILSYQNVALSNRTIYIYRRHERFNTSYYVALIGSTNPSLMVCGGLALNAYDLTVRFATEEEKKKLFDTIKEMGYKWNAETKTLEKFVESKFDPKTLEAFDKVLVRDRIGRPWTCGIFSHANFEFFYPFKVGIFSYKWCIPYNEDTKHLVGTTKEAPEYYRYWED